MTAIIAAWLPIGLVAELTNIGTLAAFIIVSIAVIVLRRTRPDLERKFKCPGVPFTPLLSVFFCGLLIYKLPHLTQIRFVVWLLIGFVVYFTYSYKHSTMQIAERAKENQA